MRRTLTVLAVVGLLNGCGVETASTAATAAATKLKEAEQAEKTMAQVRSKLGALPKAEDRQ